MNDKVIDLKTDQNLLRALQEASQRKQTPQEVQAQRISFVYGSMKSDNSLTREQVKKIVVRQDGTSAE